jgi:bifunctional DNA-binding transcriptional regulator/antitoxin component of YhaV-PrlF toxin-antitoxin module
VLIIQKPSVCAITIFSTWFERRQYLVLFTRLEPLTAMSELPGRYRRRIKLDCRNAVLQNFSMTTLTLNKRGGITLPPAIRRRMGLDSMDNPLLVVEERDGGIFLHPATAMLVRDIPAQTIQAWIREDEVAMLGLKKASRKVPRRT